MEENEYRSLYHEINELRCVFEKAILRQCCQCSVARHFNLAERIGVACTQTAAQQLCTDFLKTMHTKSAFAVHAEPGDAPLPHAREIKIQCGSIIGLQQELLHTDDAGTRDIHALLSQALEQYDAIEALPYEQVIRGVANYEGRRRKKR